MLRNHWIVADMDGTLTPTPSKAGGKYLPLTHSPCLRPLAGLLQHGLNVCVVSTAGKRMWTQVFECLKPTLQAAAPPHCGTLALCGFSGAALFVSQKISSPSSADTPNHNYSVVNMIEDHAFRECNETVIAPHALPQLERVLRERFLNVMETIRKDPHYIPTLSKKYHAPLEDLVSRLAQHPNGEGVDALLSMQQLKQHGLYLTETNDALVDMQTVHVDGVPDPLVVQYTVLAVPMKYFDSIFTEEVRSELSTMGFVCKSQPNSVVVCRKGIDKATCVRWLCERYQNRWADGSAFSLDRALAFGDIPVSIDKPLTQFPPMSFVSVSIDPTLDPPGLLSLGGEELGTAAFLTALLEDVRQKSESTSPVANNDAKDERGEGSSSYFTEAKVTELLEKARRSLAETQGKL
jgi:hypothetical protein